MSAFTARLEGSSSASNAYSGDAPPPPLQPASHPSVINQHSSIPTHAQPSHSQLELQHQHFQAQLQLHHLQSQKQRQLDSVALALQHQSISSAPPPPPATSVSPAATASFASISHQSFGTLNPTASTPSTFPFDPLSTTSDLSVTYLTSSSITSTIPTSTVGSSTAALSPMDVLHTTAIPEPTLPQSHALQQPYVFHSITSTQPSSLSLNAKQSHTAPVVAHIQQHSHHNVGQGHQTHSSSASSTAIPGHASMSSPVTQDQSLPYPLSLSNGPSFADNDFLRRASQSSIGSDMAQRLLDSRIKQESALVAPSPRYKLDARIIQKKDQIEELSTPGYKAPARSVEEVRTGQQFLIKLQFLRADGSHATEFPTMRLERRNAINTSGEPASEAEALTLEIVVRLEKSGQVRRGACAKCCHKYGPSSPILILLDPFCPSPTDPTMFSHIDIYTGSLTLLAKVICSSTDHSERGNKDKYIFEFRVRRASPSSGSMHTSLSPGHGDVYDGSEMSGGGEILASCTTTPVMCSGHHKAKRLLVDQRVEKANKGAPTPKTKVIKHRKSTDGSMSPPYLVADSDTTSEHTSTPAPMTHSPSTYPVTSHAVTPSVLDTRMTSQEGHSPPPLFPLFPDTISRTTPQPQLDDYVATQLRTTLVSSAPSTTAGLSPASAVPPNPSISEIRPNHGPIRKTTHVAIRGLSFRAGMVPYFGCFPASDIVVETSTLLLCRVPESPLPGTVAVTICEGVGTSYANLSEFTYTDDNETELLILQLQLRMAHRALEYLHAQATGQHGSAADILRNIPTQLSPPPLGGSGGSGGSHAAAMHAVAQDLISASDDSSADTQSSDRRPLTLEQVEQGLLKTIEHLPMAIDVSMQLEDGSNMLHLSILLGFTSLAMELISLGCETEVRDRWGFTPLMYAVFKGRRDIAYALVQAGASASGAKTPEEFYNGIGRPVEQTPEMSTILSLACGRYQSDDYCQWLPGLPHDYPSVKSEEIEIQKSLVQDEAAQPLVRSSVTGFRNNSNVTEEAVMSRLPRLLEGLHALTTVSPHRHQNLPLLQDANEEQQHGLQSPRTISSHELADEAETVVPASKQEGTFDEASGAMATTTTEREQESGYHSGVISEVQDRLKELHRQQLPTKGIDMTVRLRRLETSSAMLAASSSSAMVAEAVAATLVGMEAASSSTSKAMEVAGSLSSTSPSPTTESAPTSSPFRTGDHFVFDFNLAVNPAMTDEGFVLPNSYLGLRFPPELVKRVSGKAPALLDEMTYEVRCSVELGPHGAPAVAAKEGEEVENDENGDRIKLAGACKDCNKWLHEQGRHSPSRSTSKGAEWNPVLQFGIPMSPDHHHPAQLTGVVELRQGWCEVKGRVHCSSMHHLVQREKERFSAIKREREQLQTRLQQQGSSEYDPQWKAKLQAEANQAIKDLKDPGYVFVFELVHPITKEVVTTARTTPMIFRTFQRRK